MAKLSVSAFASPEKLTQHLIKRISLENVDSIHIDCMDGKFVPLTGISVEYIFELQKMSCLPINVHLMVNDVVYYLKKLKAVELDWVAIHVESQNSNKAKVLLQEIRDMGRNAVLAISPDTNIDIITLFLEYIDGVLLMSTYPGTPNSSFLDSIYKRINMAKKILGEKEIIIDGGLNQERAEKCIERGATTIIQGRAFFERI